jgi:hypothetical protein
VGTSSSSQPDVYSRPTKADHRSELAEHVEPRFNEGGSGYENLCKNSHLDIRISQKLRLTGAN